MSIPAAHIHTQALDLLRVPAFDSNPPSKVVLRIRGTELFLDRDQPHPIEPLPAQSLDLIRVAERVLIEEVSVQGNPRFVYWAGVHQER